MQATDIMNLEQASQENWCFVGNHIIYAKHHDAEVYILTMCVKSYKYIL